MFHSNRTILTKMSISRKKVPCYIKIVNQHNDICKDEIIKKTRHMIYAVATLCARQMTGERET